MAAIVNKTQQLASAEVATPALATADLNAQIAAIVPATGTAVYTIGSGLIGNGAAKYIAWATLQFQQ